jgi:hypothetical protein
MGGLIVQNLLLHSSGRTILTSTVGIIFLGTPHFRSEPDWIDFGVKIAKCVTRRDPISTRPDSGDTRLLGEINHEFYAALPYDPKLGKRLGIYFFSERLPVYRVGLVLLLN